MIKPTSDTLSAADTSFDDLCAAIESKTAVVGVIGLGYVGLPLIRAFVNEGWRTMGFDVDQRKVQQLASGRSYIKHVPDEWIVDWLAADQFVATSDLMRLSEPDVLLMCVPTPLSGTRDPDLSFVETTTRHIAQSLRPGQLIVLESTTYPGTTRDVLLPLLSETGLQVGEDFFLAYSPEREDPGNTSFTASSIPKVVGGYDQASLQLACALYSQAMTRVIPVSSCEVAEACKILENTYRSVNIAMVNEMKLLFDRLDIDLWEVIDAAKTKPFGFQAFYPGPGLGGHCIPIDPFYLSWLARKHQLSTRFIELAGEINTAMPEFVVNKVAHALNVDGKPIRGSKILVLGVAYKKDIDDPRESPSFKLMELMLNAGADISYNDPHIQSLPKMRRYHVPDMQSQALTESYLRKQDLVLIATDHSTYDYDFIVKHANLVVDTRNATKNVRNAGNRVFKA